MWAWGEADPGDVAAAARVGDGGWGVEISTTAVHSPFSLTPRPLMLLPSKLPLPLTLMLPAAIDVDAAIDTAASDTGAGAAIDTGAAAAIDAGAAAARFNRFTAGVMSVMLLVSLIGTFAPTVSVQRLSGTTA